MKLWDDFKKQTEGMTKKEKTEYLFTYYWYYMLLVAAGVFLLIFLPVHFLTLKDSRPQFQLAIVNQSISQEKLEKLKADFSNEAGINSQKIVFDAGYLISGETTDVQSYEQSNYEKLFFQWQNGELDAILMPESFYQFCVDAGGAFLDLSQFRTAGVSGYVEKNVFCGIYVRDTKLASYFEEPEKDPLLFVFPATGRHLENVQKFLTFLAE